MNEHAGHLILLEGCEGADPEGVVFWGKEGGEDSSGNKDSEESPDCVCLFCGVAGWRGKVQMRYPVQSVIPDKSINSIIFIFIMSSDFIPKIGCCVNLFSRIHSVVYH